MMAVANTEHLDSMIKYIQDPLNNPKPSLRIENIKEYKEVSETLYKIVAGATTPSSGKGKDKSPMFDALTSKPVKQIEEVDEEELNITDVVELPVIEKK
jgi:hypothetical protein